MKTFDDTVLKQLEENMLKMPPFQMKGHPRASVALILRSRVHQTQPENADSRSIEKRLELLFIKRAVRPGDRWSGHVGFPGGRQDVKKDGRDDMRTAIRETKEEIGIDLSSPRFRLIGQLDDRPLYHWFSKRIIVILSAFVFLLDDDDSTELHFKLDRKEVGKVIWADMTESFSPYLSDPSLLRKNPIELTILKNTPFGQRIKNWLPMADTLHDLILGKLYFPAIQLPNERKVILWGLSMGLTSDLLDLMMVVEDQAHYLSLAATGVWFDAPDVTWVLDLTRQWLRPSTIGRRSSEYQHYNWGIHAAQSAAIALTVRGGVTYFVFQGFNKARSKL